MTVASNSCPLLQLPTELLAHILKKVDGQSLIAVSETCHLLHALLKLRDDIWRDAAVESLVRPSSSTHKTSSSGGNDDDSRSLCAPYTSHRELYLKLLPFTWFTPGIWHGNRDLHGSVYVSRYNRSTGHLEAYELHCGYDRQSATSFAANLAAIASTLAQTEWSVNPAVLIQNFNPSLQLSATPVLKFTPTTTYDKLFEIEQPRSPRGMTTSFFHAARLSPDRVFYSQMSVWPPQRIPAPERTRNESPTGFRGQVVVNNIINKYTISNSSSSSSNSSSKGAVCCEHIFRLRRWISFVHADAYGVIMGERVETVARLQPELYTPDAEHSLRGLWVGDYDSHGGEFILFHQDESDKNRLEAIKLTGDANVPRGEVTFVVDDLSHVERVATEPEWPGARVVAARGHTAMLNFVNGTFSPTQLIIVNENLVAHYWINLYRIMMYRRVNVDDLLAGGSGLV